MTYINTDKPQYSDDALEVSFWFCFLSVLVLVLLQTLQRQATAEYESRCYALDDGIQMELFTNYSSRLKVPDAESYCHANNATLMTVNNEDKMTMFLNFKNSTSLKNISWIGVRTTSNITFFRWIIQGHGIYFHRLLR